MASKQSTVDFLTEQMQKAGAITSSKMFGEYAIYCDGKVVALVCDDQLFVKPTDVGLKFLDSSHFAPAYPDSKNYLKVPESKCHDSDSIADFIIETAPVFPLP